MGDVRLLMTYTVRTAIERRDFPDQTGLGQIIEI